jgi:hypothetical protein
MKPAEYWIDQLKLQPYARESGYFLETYRAADAVSGLPERFISDPASLIPALPGPRRTDPAAGF